MDTYIFVSCFTMLFEGNDQSKSIAMTAPVRMEMSDKGSD